MTFLWFIVWFVWNLVGDSEPLLFLSLIHI